MTWDRVLTRDLAATLGCGLLRVCSHVGLSEPRLRDGGRAKLPPSEGQNVPTGAIGTAGALGARARASLADGVS